MHCTLMLKLEYQKKKKKCPYYKIQMKLEKIILKLKSISFDKTNCNRSVWSLCLLLFRAQLEVTRLEICITKSGTKII
jgi:hypothetical protein